MFGICVMLLLPGLCVCECICARVFTCTLGEKCQKGNTSSVSSRASLNLFCLLRSGLGHHSLCSFFLGGLTGGALVRKPCYYRSASRLCIFYFWNSLAMP